MMFCCGKGIGMRVNLEMHQQSIIHAGVAIDVCLASEELLRHHFPLMEFVFGIEHFNAGMWLEAKLATSPSTGIHPPRLVWISLPKLVILQLPQPALGVHRGQNVLILWLARQILPGHGSPSTK